MKTETSLDKYRKRAQKSGAKNKAASAAARLFICVIIFAAIFAAKELFSASAAIGRDFNLENIFKQAGYAMKQSDIGEAVEVLFTASDGEEIKETEYIYPDEVPCLSENYEVIVLHQKKSQLPASQVKQEETVSLPEEQIKEPEDKQEQEVSEEDKLKEKYESMFEGADDPPETASYTYYTLGVKFCMPVNGEVTSPFGYRKSPINGKYSFHHGTDIAAPKGTKIAAAADGEVISTGYSSVYGNYIKIDHGDGITTFYAHCRKLVSQEGEYVKAGEKIAEVGSTGSSTGAHLHFEIALNGVRLNAEYYIDIPA